MTPFGAVTGGAKGASQGEGLGNQFLAHIRETDAIAHVVRCFENDDVVHVSGRIDPLSDIEVINTELSLADLESVEREMVLIESLSHGRELLELAEQIATDLAPLPRLTEVSLSPGVLLFTAAVSLGAASEAVSSTATIIA